MSVWDSVKEIEIAKNLILDGYVKSKWFESDSFLDRINLPSTRCILDVGCGIGRNLSAIVDSATQATIYGYDYPNMIEMAKTYMDENKLKKIRFINPPCSNLSTLKCDLIIETLVFQHIPEQELRQLLSVLANILSSGGKMLSFGRGYIDDMKKNKWKIILDYFTPVLESSLNPHNGTEDHQLVILVSNINNSDTVKKNNETVVITTR